MANFFETLMEVLKADERFFSVDGTLLRNKVYETAVNMDEPLIRLLLSNPSDITKGIADFKVLPTNDKKQFILELLDKNMLYVNLCDLDDEEYAIHDADKAFTRSFYGMEGDRA